MPQLRSIIEYQLSFFRRFGQVNIHDTILMRLKWKKIKHTINNMKEIKKIHIIMIIL